jgi:hypothetical protein
MLSQPHFRNARGAMLVHVAVMLLALMAFSALSFDYGVLFVSRRQAQNSADAAALAASTSLSFVDANDLPLARNSAIAAAQRNVIWGQPPDILPADVTFPACPPGAPGVPDTCVRADVHRTNYQRAAGSPLPTFFANIFGVGEQGTRATATAQMLAGSGTADCVKPVAVPDRWVEFRPNPGPWLPTSEFERYQQNGNNAGALLDPADLYTPPSANSPGSGFTLPTDYGVEIRLKEGNPNEAIDPGFFYPIVLDPNCIGGDCYREAWAGCSGITINPGMVMNPEPGNLIGPTRQGVQALIDSDSGAYWDPAANGGRGAPAGGCMGAGTCSRSPRWVAIPLFNVDEYSLARVNQQNGRNTPITIVKIIGFFLDRIQANNIYGRIMFYPTTSVTGTPLPGSALFTRTIILVR